MRVGYTIWEWGLECENDLVTAMHDIKKLGYRYFENFIGMADLYENRETELNHLIKECGLEFVALYHYITDLEADNLRMAEKYLKFCQKTGAKYMNIQAPDRKGEPAEPELERLAQILNGIGKMALDYDVTLCLHPHFQMMVEQEKEVDFIAQNTEPEYVHFCFDTAHMVLAQMDFSRVFEKYKERMGFIHLKDQDVHEDIDEYRRKWVEEWGKHQRFYELGTKGIDFVRVIELLRKAGYDGYLMIENDTPTMSNYEGAKANRDYVKKILKL